MISIHKDEIHLYYFQFDESSADINRYNSLLSAKEIERANRFIHESDQKRFRYCHGLLRHLLSLYTLIPAEEMTFIENSYGKPSLLNHPLQFNLSHAQHHLLFGFCLNAEIGVDIEETDRQSDYNLLSSHVFSELERKIFNHLPDTVKSTAFYNAWTRKEAFIKAIGMGLSFSLQNISVSMAPEQPAEILEIKSDLFNKNDWSIHNLEYADNTKSAMVTKLKTPKILQKTL